MPRPTPLSPPFIPGVNVCSVGTLPHAMMVPTRQAGLESDMLKEQVTVHRSEFAELEASTTRKTSELQLLLEGERDKV